MLMFLYTLNISQLISLTYFWFRAQRCKQGARISLASKELLLSTSNSLNICHLRYFPAAGQQQIWIELLFHQPTSFLKQGEIEVTSQLNAPKSAGQPSKNVCHKIIHGRGTALHHCQPGDLSKSNNNNNNNNNNKKKKTETDRNGLQGHDSKKKSQIVRWKFGDFLVEATYSIHFGEDPKTIPRPSWLLSSQPWSDCRLHILYHLQFGWLKSLAKVTSCAQTISATIALFPHQSPVMSFSNKTGRFFGPPNPSEFGPTCQLQPR